MAGGQALDAQRAPAFSFDPNDLLIVETPGDPLCQRDRNALPVTREAVIAIAQGPPASSIRVRRLEDGRNAVVTGRQRTKAACVANALGAGVPYAGTLPAVKEAIAKFREDADLIARVTTLMRNKPIRLTALAANADIQHVRGMIATENALAQAEQRRAIIAAVQEDVNVFEIPVQLVAEQRGVDVQTIRRWLKVDVNAPAEKPKRRGKAKRPSAKRVKQIATVDKLPRSVVLAMRWAIGDITDEEWAAEFPSVAEHLGPAAKAKEAA